MITINNSSVIINNYNATPVEEEQWKTINDFHNYQISNFGKVKVTNNGKYMKQRVTNRYYYSVSLFKDGKYTYFSIHRLVALHFIPNPNLSKIVDHIDGNPTNNHYKNLRWCSIAQNTMNSKKRANKTSSKYKGVYYDKVRQRWAVRVGGEGYRKRFGTYKTEIEAANIYNIKAIEMFGEFAKLNEINE